LPIVLAAGVPGVGGLRGAVPIVLATIPLTTGVPGAARLFDLVFIIVIVFNPVSGPSTAPPPGQTARDMLAAAISPA